MQTGLGDVLICRRWVKTEILRLLEDGFEKLDNDQFLKLQDEAKIFLATIAEEALRLGVLRNDEFYFLLSLSDASCLGRFRLRIKLHKEPCVGRPIVNSSRTLLEPAAIMLCSGLKALQREQKFVLEGSKDFLEKVPRTFNRNMKIATIDAVNLYPSIDEFDMIRTLCRKLNFFYRHDQNLCNFYVQLTKLVVAYAFVEHEDTLWRAHGIATGIKPGVFLANCYVADMDPCVASLPGLCYYGRYVDDSIIIALDMDAVLEKMNSWRSSIRWAITEVGGRTHAGEVTVPFLDLSLSQKEGCLCYKTYEKKLNAYLYVPRESCHPTNVFRSVIQSEAVRALRNNMLDVDLRKNLDRFRSRLQKRGYSNDEITLGFKRAFVSYKNRHKKVCQKDLGLRRAFLVLTYTDSLNIQVIKKHLKRYALTYSNMTNTKTEFGIAYKVQKNNFRLLYKYNWMK